MIIRVNNEGSIRSDLLLTCIYGQATRLGDLEIIISSAHLAIMSRIMTRLVSTQSETQVEIFRNSPVFAKSTMRRK